MNTLTARFDVQYATFHLHAAVDVPLQGVTAIFGPSGCGKTTFLRCMAGLERSSRGVIHFGDVVWQDEARKIFLPVMKRPIGYVFQEPRLFPHLSVRANLIYGFKRVPRQQQRLSFERIVEILDLHNLLKRRPHHLSGGEQQRVAIGRALLTSPALLLMDEPLSSLDMTRKNEILPFLQRLNQDLRVPVLYVSHDLNEILQLADHVVVIKEGTVVATGTIQDVFARLDLPGLVEPNVVGAVLETTVADHEPQFGLTRVEFAGRSLFIPQQALPVGTSLRVQILARDVSLVVGVPAAQSSVLNALDARVIEIGESRSDPYTVKVKLDVGCPLLAMITRKSLHQLKLHPGQNVQAHFKAVALRW